MKSLKRTITYADIGSVQSEIIMSDAWALDILHNAYTGVPEPDETLLSSRLVAVSVSPTTSKLSEQKMKLRNGFTIMTVPSTGYDSSGKLTLKFVDLSDQTIQHWLASMSNAHISHQVTKTGKYKKHAYMNLRLRRLDSENNSISGTEFYTCMMLNAPNLQAPFDTFNESPSGISSQISVEFVYEYSTFVRYNLGPDMLATNFDSVPNNYNNGQFK